MPSNQISQFNLRPGRVLARKYEVIDMLGAGWEGEVYLIREIATGIERTAKIFFPQRNIKDKAVLFYAKKLHKLHHCPITIQYSTQESFLFRGTTVTMLISEYVEGELLSHFLNRQPGKRLPPFSALHLLHSLAVGMECIHSMGEYHGDLHTENVIVQRYGLRYELKLIDMFNFGKPNKENIRCDTIDLIHIFYQVLGGKKHYPKQPAEIKAICCGLKKSLILKKFRTASELRQYIEMMQWQ
jgi:tRNA A-37 threonylcarbamoyl transferase component Bud32